MPRTELIQVRVTPENKERILRVANALYLEPSAWVRSVVMQAVEEYEQARGLGATGTSTD